MAVHSALFITNDGAYQIGNVPTWKIKQWESGVLPNLNALNVKQIHWGDHSYPGIIHYFDLRSKNKHIHCHHTTEQHEHMGWSCDFWPRNGPCCET